MILESLQLLPKDSAAGPHTVNALITTWLHATNL